MAGTRGSIRFLLNDREVELADVAASDTLLDHLRLDARLCGTKEGCAEGDCGACTVLVGRLTGGRLVYETVNACIRLTASVDSCHVVTVEHLAGRGGPLAPVQQAMVDHHASQCGFCTPGIVMSLHALWRSDPDPGDVAIETALQGNLCRCTGYRPIVDAAKAAARQGAQVDDPLARKAEAVTARLSALCDGRRVDTARGSDRAILPADVDDLARVLEDHPHATIVAGMTDVGLWVTKHMRDISPAVFTGHLDELRQVSVAADGLTIGAGASYTECGPALTAMFPHLVEFWPRIGGAQVRNMGTVGGNIANGSPIGDTPPVLIALGATITLRKGAARRRLALEDFFIDYGRQDRQPGEFVEAIHVPAPGPDTIHAAYKVSKRRDEDISSVCAAFALTVTDGKVSSARLAFGGMAATPKRAANAEAALVGSVFDAAAVDRAVAALRDDFTPIGDWRASARYRALVAGNLLRRFHLEQTSHAKVRLRRDEVPA